MSNNVNSALKVEGAHIKVMVSPHLWRHYKCVLGGVSTGEA